MLNSFYPNPDNMLHLEDDWAHHKLRCQHEPKLQVVRDLRRLMHRFGMTLDSIVPCCLGLDVAPSRVNTHGVLLVLEPRPEGPRSAKFSIQSIMPVTMAVIEHTCARYDPDLWALHCAEGIKFAEENHGSSYATVLVRATGSILDGPTLYRYEVPLDTLNVVSQGSCRLKHVNIHLQKIQRLIKDFGSQWKQVSAQSFINHH